VGRLPFLPAALVAALAAAASATAGTAPLVFETEDWHFESPAALGTQADRTFAVSYSVARSDTGDPVDTAAVRCSARLGKVALRVATRTFDRGRAACSWRLPHPRTRVVVATTTVEYLGVSARRSVSARLG
jgi:hypothetical protein